jgi:hypothetical protein
MRKLFAAALIAGAAPTAPASAQDEHDKIWAKIQPARAAYVLRQRGQGPEGAAISGKMTLEARLTCDELASATTMELRVTSGAQSMTVSFEQSATETRDGKVYRFSARTLENGRVSDTREGQAVLQSRDGPGEAKIKGASAEDVKIEAGAMLPGTHLMRVMAAAAAGKTALEHRVFYGLDQMKIALARVEIKGAGRSAKLKSLGDYADKPGWTIREEHKELGGGPDSASQATEMFVTEDLVATSIVLQLQGLELEGTPISIEKLPKPECKS